jgi:hypothetical protein
MSIRNELLEKIYEAVASGGNTDEYIKSLVSEQSGWGVYVDSLHTSESPQSIADGVTATLSNNSNLIIGSQVPTDATPPLWNAATGKFVPIKLNDYYTWVVRFKAKNTATQGAYINVGIDIGGTFGSIFNETKVFVKGSGVEQEFNVAMMGYTGSTFMANGGIPKLTSSGGTTTVYGKEFHIVRHHTGR